MIVVTHYQRLLNYIVPDFVHVLADGRIVKSGGKELALELEESGYAGLGEEAVGARMTAVAEQIRRAARGVSPQPARWLRRCARRHSALRRAGLPHHARRRVALHQRGADRAHGVRARRPAHDVRGGRRSRYADGRARLVFVNGRYAPELSRSCPGRPRGSLRRSERRAERTWAATPPFEDHAFVALNTAFFEDGACVRDAARRGGRASRSRFVFLATGGEAPVAAHPRSADRGRARTAQATVVETYVGLTAHSYFTNAVTEIVAGENAVVDHYKVQREGAASLPRRLPCRWPVGRGANFSSHSISLGGALVRNDVNGRAGGRRGSHR